MAKARIRLLWGVKGSKGKMDPRMIELDVF